MKMWFKIIFFLIEFEIQSFFLPKKNDATKRKVMPRIKKEPKPPQQQQQQQQQLSSIVTTVEQQQAVTTIVPSDKMYGVHFERNEGQGYLEKRIEPVPMQVQQGQPVQQRQQQQPQHTEGHLVATEDRSVLTMVSVENGEVALLRQQTQNQNEVPSFQGSQLTPITHAHVSPVSHMVPLAAPPSGHKWNPQTFPLTHPVSLSSQSTPQLHLTSQPVTLQQPVIGLPVALPVSQSETTLLMCQSEEVIAATRNVNYQ